MRKKIIPRSDKRWASAFGGEKACEKCGCNQWSTTYTNKGKEDKCKNCGDTPIQTRL